MQFKFIYSDSTEEVINGDQLQIGADFLTVLDGGAVVAYRPRLNVKSADRVSS